MKKTLMLILIMGSIAMADIKVPYTNPIEQNDELFTKEVINGTFNKAVQEEIKKGKDPLARYAGVDIDERIKRGKSLSDFDPEMQSYDREWTQQVAWLPKYAEVAEDEPIVISKHPTPKQVSYEGEIDARYGLVAGVNGNNLVLLENLSSGDTGKIKVIEYKGATKVDEYIIELKGNKVENPTSVDLVPIAVTYHKDKSYIIARIDENTAFEASNYMAILDMDGNIKYSADIRGEMLKLDSHWIVMQNSGNYEVIDADVFAKTDSGQIDVGVNDIDTASIYVNADNDKLMLKAHADKYVYIRSGGRLQLNNLKDLPQAEQIQAKAVLKSRWDYHDKSGMPYKYSLKKRGVVNPQVRMPYIPDTTKVEANNKNFIFTGGKTGYTLHYTRDFVKNIDTGINISGVVKFLVTQKYVYVKLYSKVVVAKISGWVQVGGTEREVIAMIQNGITLQ